jgi:hypothetical protein
VPREDVSAERRQHFSQHTCVLKDTLLDNSRAEWEPWALHCSRSDCGNPPSRGPGASVPHLESRSRGRVPASSAVTSGEGALLSPPGQLRLDGCPLLD